jgi:CBS domain-containing protein/ribosome-associated translation inhibitor RaiA
MRLKELMTTDVVSVSPDEAADAAWNRMARRGIRHLLVKDGGQLLGVVSERDLGGRKGGPLRRGRAVRDLMSARVVTAEPGTTLRQAANLMRDRLVGSLPIMDAGRVVGIVTATDVLHELGRGSSRPAVQARRKSMRLPPSAAREAKRTSGRKGKARSTRGRRRRAPSSPEASGVGREPGSASSSAATGRNTPSLGRGRVRLPESSKRAPFAGRVPRPQRRAAGRTSPGETPAHIRSVDSLLDAADEAYVRRKLGRKLGKFALSIERVSVRVEDVNGPRGGVDKRCRIKIVLAGLPSVLVEERGSSLQGAMDGALAKAERVVRKALQKRQMKPRRTREQRGPSRSF